MTSEPDDLSVGDQDDGQVLEDRVNRDRQVLKRFRTGVDDRDQQGRDREPDLGVLHVKVTEVDDSHFLGDVDEGNTDDGLDRQ